MATAKENKGHENLIPFAKRTEAEQRKIRQKGGIASGKARRLKKTLTESLKEICTPEAINEINNRLLLMAKRGNLKAYELIRDGLGEKPTDKLEVSGTLDIADAFAAAKKRREERLAKEKQAGESG